MGGASRLLCRLDFRVPPENVNFVTNIFFVVSVENHLFVETPRILNEMMMHFLSDFGHPQHVLSSHLTNHSLTSYSMSYIFLDKTR